MTVKEGVMLKEKEISRIVIDFCVRNEQSINTSLTKKRADKIDEVKKSKLLKHVNRHTKGW